jgi:hypothetical protein
MLVDEEVKPLIGEIETFVRAPDEDHGPDHDKDECDDFS